jgi:hypothetical protein
LRLRPLLPGRTSAERGTLIVKAEKTAAGYPTFRWSSRWQLFTAVAIAAARPQ